MNSFKLNLCLFLFLKSVTSEATPTSSTDPAHAKTIIIFEQRINNYNNCDTSTEVPTWCDCGGDGWFIIQSTTGGYVLDASEPNQIKLQHFTGYAPQLWKFERARKPGTYHIVSNHTGTVLDVNPKDNKTVMLKKKDGSLTQQWATSWTGRIRHVATSKQLDVHGANFAPGTSLVVWGDNGSKAQEFTWLQKL